MRKHAISVLIIIMVLIASACGHIKDNNGDDTSLTTMSLEMVGGKSISNTTSGVSSRSVRNNYTIVSQYNEIDLDSVVLSGGLTSGISSILATELRKGDILIIDCHNTIESGNLAVILISPSNEMLYHFNNNDMDSCQITADEDGIYIIRRGAESYTGNIYLKRTIIRP